jgi:hypothetical protein
LNKIKSFGFLVCIMSLVGAQVERDMVILEIATGTWCYYCPGSSMGADDLIANGHNVAVIEYHQYLGFESYANIYSDARFNYYEMSGCPTAVFDGIILLAAGDPSYSLYEDYLPRYNVRNAVPSSFNMDLSGEEIGLDYAVSVTANKVAPTSSTNIVLHLVLTESQIAEEWQGQTELNFVERLMIPDQYGTALDFSTGDAQTVNLGFTLDPGWASSNCELVAFIQDNNSKEILQGTKVNLTEMEALEVEKFTNTIPEFFHLYQNYPNPFNASTTIQYELKENSAITISIFNIHGKEIDMIVNDYQQAGEHSITWNGQYVPSGIYFIRLSSGEIVQTRKAVLLK